MTQKRSLFLIGAGIVILVSGARYFWFGTEAARHAVEPHAHHQAPSSSERKVLYYRHPMGKNVKSPVPMKDEMGMDFIPVYAEEAPREPRGPVDGRTAFLLSESGRQLIGVRTAKVERQSVNYEIKASGRVAFDPELYTVVSEYKVAKAAAGLTHQSAAAIQGGAQAMLQAVKLKLKLRGLSDKQIQMIEQGKFEADDLLLPQGRVWVYADVYEYELPNLKEGQVIEAESALYADKQFKGKVISVSSIINAETRTVEVKAEVLDPEKLLKPDMFLTVRINADLGEQLVIPEDAVIRTGDLFLVFIDDGSGRFEPRRVALGAKSGDRYIVLSGLKKGETVAAGANFLIDSESRLQTVLQNMAEAHTPQPGQVADDR